MRRNPSFVGVGFRRVDCPWTVGEVTPKGIARAEPDQRLWTLTGVGKGVEMQRPDLVCHECGSVQADWLMFRKKYYRESGKEALLDPALMCIECKRVADRGHRNVDGQMVFISFADIGAKPEWFVGMLTSGKKFESNQMSSKFWKSKLWRIRAWAITEERRRASNDG